MKEVKLDDRTSWQRSHWRSICSSYSRSPWFEFYRDELEKLYSTPHYYLADWNIQTLLWLVSKLEISVPVSSTREYEKAVADPQIRDYRDHFLPKNVGTDIMQIAPYSQVFQDKIGFIPNLCVLDLLFCEGPNAGRKFRGDFMNG